MSLAHFPGLARLEVYVFVGNLLSPEAIFSEDWGAPGEKTKQKNLEDHTMSSIAASLIGLSRGGVATHQDAGRGGGPRRAGRVRRWGWR